MRLVVLILGFFEVALRTGCACRCLSGFVRLHHAAVWVVAVHAIQDHVLAAVDRFSQRVSKTGRIHIVNGLDIGVIVASAAQI